MTSRLSFTWSTRRDGNDGFVLEEAHEDGTLRLRREYGPMPPHIVPAFVEGRRRITAERAQAEGASYVEGELTPDYEYLRDSGQETPQ